MLDTCCTKERIGVIALLTILAVPLSAVAPVSTPDVQPAPPPPEPITISAETTPQDLIDAARADLAQKHWAAAAARLAAARARLEAPPPVLAYDQGVAATNAGDLAGAAAAFDAAMKTASDPQLAADAAYNLGNVSHQLIAQQQTDQTQQAGQQHGAATATLEEALAHYRTAIARQPDNADARANAQLTWQRLQELKQQQEQQQKQDQQGEQDQPPDQEQEQDQQGDQEPNPDQQQQNEQDQQGEQDQQQQQQEQSAGQEQQPDQQKQQQQEPAAQPAAPKELSREEAQRLLQRVRDREREQAQQETKETPGRSVTGKDW